MRRQGEAMTQETITAIITVEKEIQARVAAEEKKIDQWLADQAAAAAQELDQGLNALRLQQSEEEGRIEEEVNRQTADILTAAEQEAQRFTELAQDELEALLKRHLKTILPQ